MFLINSVKAEHLSPKTHFNTGFYPNRQIKMTEPLKCDTFTPSFKGTPSLSEETLARNGNFPEILLCRQFNMDLKNFKSLEDIHKWAEKEYTALKDFNSVIYNIYDGDPRLLLQRFTQGLDNPFTGEKNPVKKMLIYSDFFMQGEDKYIVPYNKDIMDETFREIFDMINQNKKEDLSIYKLYKNKMLNSDKIPLHIYHSGDKLAVVTDYKQPTGIAAITPEGYFSDLEVFPEYRHSKISKQTLEMLFKEAEKIAKSDNLDKIKLDVLTENKSAASGYINKQGFKVVDFDLKKVYQRMEKSLKEENVNSEELLRREQETDLYNEFLQLDEQSLNEILSKTAHNVENYRDTLEGCEKWHLSSKGFGFIKKYIQIKGL